MSKHPFTRPQAEHALEVVLGLMQKRRFFLYQHDSRSIEKNPDFTLDPQVFGPALKLDHEVREVYASARASAEKDILDTELRLGVAKPDLSGNRQTVQCNRYTGGLDICRVFPLAAFSPYVPKSLDALTKQCLQQLLGGAAEDDVTPKRMRMYLSGAGNIAARIWSELLNMGADDPNNPLCVVMMRTRFDCSESDKNHDFMQGRTRKIQEFPYATGYLFWMHSMQKCVVRHDHVVLSTSRDSHVNVQHSSEKRPTIDYDARDGYTCPVFFVTTL